MLLFAAWGGLAWESGEVDAANVHAELLMEEERGAGHVKRDKETARLIEHGRQVAVGRTLGNGDLKDGRGCCEGDGVDVSTLCQSERDSQPDGVGVGIRRETELVDESGTRVGFEPLDRDSRG